MPVTKTPRIDPRIERTRHVVLETVVELLHERGFDGVTIDEVASRSGVARSTIYRNWAERGRLLFEAIESMVEFPDEKRTGEVRADLVQALSALARTISPDSPVGRLLPGLLAAAERDPDLAALYRAGDERARRALEAMADAAIRHGDLAPDVDVNALATALPAELYYRRLVRGERLTSAVITGAVDRMLADPPRRRGRS